MLSRKRRVISLFGIINGILAEMLYAVFLFVVCWVILWGLWLFFR